jgi:hypothetical protein
MTCESFASIPFSVNVYVIWVKSWLMNEKNINTHTLYIMHQTFVTYICPILEYNSVVWNPCLIHLTDLTENVQCNFSERVLWLSSLPYSERLALIDLEPLELRRLQFDLIYYFKVFNHLTPFDPGDAFLIYTPLETSLSSSPFLQKYPKASNKLLLTLFYRHIEAWNLLPAELKST